MIALWLLLACRPDPEPEPIVAPPPDTVGLEAPLLLRRLSLDLRGVLPTAEELDAVEADATQVERYRDEWLADPRLEERLVELFAERWHTRIDQFEVRHYDYGLEDAQEYEFESAVGEEPLRLMARVAVEDRPWTETVTADWTMANEVLAGIHPVAGFPGGETGWHEVTYTDGRPAVGVLATNGLWWRYTTNISNQNRSRAAAIANLLLCEDLLSRPVSFGEGVSLEDDDAATAAIRTQPTCLACHSSVEPLAAAMFGFWVAVEYNPLELGSYHAEREPMGPELLGVEPAYFGEPIEGLVDLGAAVANDPRFWRCTAQSAAESLWRRPVELGDFDRVTELEDTFLASDLRYRELLRAVTDTPEYRAGGVREGVDAEAVRDLTVRMLSAEQLASAVEDLTGFRWSWQGFDLLKSDDVGYRVLAGGVDGFYVGRPQQDPGLTWAVVVRRVAQAAASYAVERELVGKAPEKKLFRHVVLEDQPGSEAFRAELEELHWRMYARRATPERIEALEELWTGASGGVAFAGWTAVISAMLRDPEMVGY